MFFYLFFEIWVWLLVAFALGWLAHWLLCCRNTSTLTEKKEDPASLNLITSQQSQPLVNQPVSDDWKPVGFESPPTKIDNLKRIKGVGSVLEASLNELGIYQFSQIAAWSQDNISWVEKFMAFPGRIERENWIEQANILAHGDTTEFANRVDTGDIDYRNE